MAGGGQSQVSAKPLNVAIIGGGLVGALAACFLAKRGHTVRLYEFRSDIRVSQEVRGRSINLALSVRGRDALREIGLEDDLVHDHGIPMMCRMIHGADCTLKEIPYDLVNHNCIYSVNRRYLNAALLNAAEKYPNIEYHFKKKLINADLETGKMIFLNRETETEEHAHADLIIGADGAHSAVRRIMMRRPLFNISQSYIEHGYMEFLIPPTKDGNAAMALNFLHIWPRSEFMLIALPNGDKSFTVTWFATFKTFESLQTSEDLLEFFREYFPDALPLLGEENLIDDFFANKPSPLISIKCEPFHVGKTAILIGDAAHAMVPFYGQGMNTGFEDCLLLDGLFEKYKSDVANILPAFSELRCSDAHEICDLAMYNYVEMRDLVNRKSFILRKYLDSFLYWLMPELWIPLYNSIHFTRMSFKKCRQNFAWQEKVVHSLLYFFGALLLLGLIAAMF